MNSPLIGYVRVVEATGEVEWISLIFPDEKPKTCLPGMKWVRTETRVVEHGNEGRN